MSFQGPRAVTAPGSHAGRAGGDRGPRLAVLCPSSRRAGALGGWAAGYGCGLPSRVSLKEGATCWSPFPPLLSPTTSKAAGQRKGRGALHYVTGRLEPDAPVRAVIWALSHLPLNVRADGRRRAEWSFGKVLEARA